ncbi:MAG: hypothetical protein JWM91_1365 [Rhodospirillales bacterium]|nr:hypothetical protein [Rhodospirillales bacterium]
MGASARTRDLRRARIGLASDPYMLMGFLEGDRGFAVARKQNDVFAPIRADFNGRPRKAGWQTHCSEGRELDALLRRAPAERVRRSLCALVGSERFSRPEVVNLQWRGQNRAQSNSWCIPPRSRQPFSADHGYTSKTSRRSGRAGSESLRAHYGREIDHAEAREMLENFTELFKILGRWERAVRDPVDEQKN